MDYLVREIQSVYRSQRVDINDKHIEIIIAQMLRKVKVETVGDTGLCRAQRLTSSASAGRTRTSSTQSRSPRWGIRTSRKGRSFRRRSSTRKSLA